MPLPELLANSPTPGSRVALATLAAAQVSTSSLTFTMTAAASAALQAGAGQFRVVIDSEIVLFDASQVSTTTWTAITRGVETSTPATHAIGAAVYHYPTAGALDARYVADTSADSKSPISAAASPRNRALRDFVSLADYGPLGGDVSTPLGQAIASGKRVFIPSGFYNTQPFSSGVAILGDDPETTGLVNLSTAGGDFFICTASGVNIAGLTIDGKRASQPDPTGGGALAVHKPNGTCPSGTFAGGMTLSVDAASAATSFQVSTATWSGVTVQPGDVLCLLDGSKTEYVMVASSYTAGATTIPLYEPLSQAYAHATCNVTCCPTGVCVENCIIKGVRRDCLYFWNAYGCRALSNLILDFADTGLDLPAGGSKNQFAHNTLRSNGRYGVAVDTTSSTTFIPRGSGNVIEGNTIEITSGGSDSLGAALEGIAVLQIDDTVIVGNVIDISKAGTNGILLLGSRRGSCQGNSIKGAGSSGTGASASGTYGIQHTSSTGFEDPQMPIVGNTIRGTDQGIRFNQSSHAVAMGNHIYNVSNYGIDIERHATIVQTLTALANRIDSCVAGIRGGGSTGAASLIHTGLNDITNASFAAITTDAGWTVTSVASLP